MYDKNMAAKMAVNMVVEHNRFYAKTEIMSLLMKIKLHLCCICICFEL